MGMEYGNKIPDIEGLNQSERDYGTNSRANKMSMHNSRASIGDSTTNGSGEYQWTSFAQSIGGLTINKYAQGGATIETAMEVLVPNLLNSEKKYKYCNVMIGINNFFAGDSVEEVKPKYVELIDMILRGNMIPIIMSIIPQIDNNEKVLTYNRWLRDFAFENDYQFIDVFSALVDFDGNVITGVIQTDNTHLTSKGAYLVFKKYEDSLSTPASDFPYQIAGATNILTNPNFSTGTGVGTGWSSLESGVTGTFTLQPDARGGNFQRIAITGGSSSNSFAWVRQAGISSGFIAGDTLEASVDMVGLDGLTSDLRTVVQITCRQGSTTLETITLFSGQDGTGHTSIPTVDGNDTGFELNSELLRFKKQFIVPEGTDNLQFILGAYGSATGYIDYAGAMLENVTI